MQTEAPDAGTCAKTDLVHRASSIAAKRPVQRGKSSGAEADVEWYFGAIPSIVSRAEWSPLE